MSKPAILTIDDDAEVLRAIAREVVGAYVSNEVEVFKTKPVIY